MRCSIVLPIIIFGAIAVFYAIKYVAENTAVKNNRSKNHVTIVPVNNGYMVFRNHHPLTTFPVSHKEALKIMDDNI